MSNRILQVQVRDRSLDPAQAEIWIRVVAERVTPTTEVRGRLTGPRCVHAATVEVAYPFRPLLRRLDGAADLTVRAVVPEPSLWEPACPFVYQGVAELWEDGRRCDQAEFRRGLRRVVLGPSGLRVNGAPTTLHGRAVVKCDETRAASLRGVGCNLLLAPVESDVWDLADVEGFFVLGAVKHLQEQLVVRAAALLDHPSCLGWVLQMPPVLWDADAIRRLAGPGRAKVGVELGEAPHGPLPVGVDFIACPSSLAVELRPLGVPLLVYGGGTPPPGVFGTAG